MIPTFPEFKKVEISDREAVESHTRRYPPYSDFNFTSLWSWDRGGGRSISELHGNLIVRFTDYKTNEPFLSFLGASELQHTIQTLLEYCKEHNLAEMLSLVPDVSVRDISTSFPFRIEEDRDNFDYVYSVPELSTLAGGKFKGRRNFVNRFLQEHPTARVEVIDLNNVEAQKSILLMMGAWADRKRAQGKEHDIENELIAVKKLFATAQSHALIVTAVFEEQNMLGFSIEELLPNQFALGHFWKANSAHTGVYDFLIQKKAQHLETLGVSFWNYEQDLGVEGLRQSKMDYRPVDFLKKYSVSRSV
jgi:hypothetical protein